MKVYAIARYTEDHYTWEDVFGVATNREKAEAKVKALNEDSSVYGDWAVIEFDTNEVKNITGKKK